ncbi:50S ribosomal protein L35ae [archaeon]|nr:50S ribosomal protein L35ae [archaeon]
MKAKIIGFKGSRRTQDNRSCILDTDDKNPAGMVGKKVFWKTASGKVIQGKIVRTHGKHSLMARFRKGIPGNAVGDSLEFIAPAPPKAKKPAKKVGKPKAPAKKKPAPKKEAPAKKAPAKKAPVKKKAAPKKAPAKKPAAKKTPAKKSAPKKTPAKPAAKKAPAKKKAAPKKKPAKKAAK